MSLGLSSGYNYLNGIGLITGGTGNYGLYGGYGLYSDQYVENTKKSIENGYELKSTNKAYGTLDTAEYSTFSKNCQGIQTLLKEGRSDDALLKFNELVDEMSGLSKYSTYTEDMLKTEALDKYRSATNGSELLSDINKYADSSFESGFKSAIPGLNFFSQSTTKEELLEEIGGIPKSDYAKASKVGGAIVGGVGTAAAGYGIFKLGQKALSSGGSGFIGRALSRIGLSGGRVGLIALAGVAIGAVGLGLKSLFSGNSSK